MYELEVTNFKRLEMIEKQNNFHHCTISITERQQITHLKKIIYIFLGFFVNSFWNFFWNVVFWKQRIMNKILLNFSFFTQHHLEEFEPNNIVIIRKTIVEIAIAFGFLLLSVPIFDYRTFYATNKTNIKKAQENKIGCSN